MIVDSDSSSQSENMSTGKFVISLDFELMWGLRDFQTIETSGERMLGVWESIPRMLELFRQYKISATWATVGFLFAQDVDQLIQSSPDKKPSYTNRNLSPFEGHFATIDGSDISQKSHFARPLIDQIRACPGQELATHTWSHYYCMESGQSLEQFRADLETAKRVALADGITLRSIVFPRNQYSSEHLEVCQAIGLTSYRGNEANWLYAPSSRRKEQSMARKILRILDAWFNLTGHHCSDLAESSKREMPNNEILNIPSSRLLRPWSKRLAFMDGWRMRRITRSMDHAARHQKVFHLWWHPHNFGTDREHNLRMLENILQHFVRLREETGMQSVSMERLAEQFTAKKTNSTSDPAETESFVEH